MRAVNVLVKFENDALDRSWPCAESGIEADAADAQ